MGLKWGLIPSLLLFITTSLGAQTPGATGFLPWLSALSSFQNSSGPDGTSLPQQPLSRTVWAPRWSFETSYQALSPWFPEAWNQTPGVGVNVSGLTADRLSYSLKFGSLLEIHSGTSAAFTEGFAAFPFAEAAASLALVPSQALREAQSRPATDAHAWAKLRQSDEGAASRRRTEDGVAAFQLWSETTSRHRVAAALARTASLAVRKLELQESAGNSSKGALVRAKAESRLADQETLAALAEVSAAEVKLRAYLPPSLELPLPDLGPDVFDWAMPAALPVRLPPLPSEDTRNEERYLAAQREAIDQSTSSVPRLETSLTVKPALRLATAAAPLPRDPWSAFKALSESGSGADVHLDIRLTIPLFEAAQDLVRTVSQRRAAYEWGLNFERHRRESALAGLVSRLTVLQTSDQGLVETLGRLDKDTETLKRLRVSGDVTEVDVAWSSYDRELLAQQIQTARREAVSLGLALRNLLEKELVP